MIKWFSSYLSGHKQRVASDSAPFEAEDPKDLSWGTLTFLIYLNDIVKTFCCSIRLFADDTSLYITVESAQIAANLINTDLDTISTWTAYCLVNFHERKTFSMVLSRKLLPPQHPSLFMNNIVLPETDSYKHLGLILSKSCTWSNHIQEIASKAWVRLNLIRTLKLRVSRKSFEQLCVSFIRPLLEYCDVVWDNCSAENKKQLESIHIEAARIITGATRLCSIEKLFSELGWEFLQSHRKKHKLIIFFKIMNEFTPNYLAEFTPNYLADIVPPLIQETTRYNLQNSNDIRTIHTNSNLFYNPFFSAAIRA